MLSEVNHQAYQVQIWHKSYSNITAYTRHYIKFLVAPQELVSEVIQARSESRNIFRREFQYVSYQNYIQSQNMH